ncbi:unnamed protein product [Caenorhabditis nigoni]
MPIRILSLPISVLQYALNCMEIDELIACSLCSKRTKILTKSSNRKIHTICAEFGTRSRIIVQHQDDELVFDFDDFWTELDRGNGVEIGELIIRDACPISHLDTVKQIIPRFQTLQISRDCSTELTKIAFRKFIPNAEELTIVKGPFDNDMHISQFIRPNLKVLSLLCWGHPYKVELDDLLLANSSFIFISSANITERELNRFVKLWMKSNHTFYRPGHIEMSVTNEINHAELLKGIKYQTVGNRHLLKRADGKELEILVLTNSVAFEFQ